MNPLVGLTEYLAKLEKNLRMFALTRGAALLGGAALTCTVLLVLIVNGYAFSDHSVFWARVALFLAIAGALAAGVVIPLVSLNRRRTARKAEQQFPQFGERLLTFSERQSQNADDPFLPLLAADALDVAHQSGAEEFVPNRRLLSLASIGVAAVMVLIWLGLSGPGFMGYGTALLWGGYPHEDRKPFYSISVEPGDHTIRRRSDQAISAKLFGFQSPHVSVFAKYASSSKWEEAAMQPQPGGPGYEFLFVGVPENVEYYVGAGGVHSNTFKLTVVDLPGVRNVKVTYHYPSWLGLKDVVEDPGGDLRAVEGTVGEVEIQTDKPLANGSIVLDDGTKLDLETRTGNKLAARVPIQKDGMYHIAALDHGEMVRLSDDYFIEARKDSPPTIKIVRPGRDAKVNPIEEVTVTVTGEDDFGLQGLDLHYAVNGGAEKTVSMLKSKGAKTGEGSTTIYLEDYKLEPGDIVALYATARDARSTTKTDIYFIETQPFEKEYSQSQAPPGGAGGGGSQDENQISQRQKEIIAATWNQVKETSKNKADAAENAKYLSDVQAKLKDQAQSLANRMKSRELAGSNPAFQSFVKDMELAVAVMGPASDDLRGLKWQEALTPEQKALQYLLRAEATFRQIQVAFGRQGGGGGGGQGASRDLESLFDLELDTDKNQYESGQQSQAEQLNRAVDDAMKKLEELARRQQQLAEQQRNMQSSQQRWQQEMLRREAEQLRRQIEQLSRGETSQQQQQGQNGQESQNGQGQSGQSSSNSSSGQQSKQQQKQQQAGMSKSGAKNNPMQRRPNAGLPPGQAQTLQQTLEQLAQATRDMGDSASSQQNGKSSDQNGSESKAQTEARRAAERLNAARQMLAGMRKQQSGDAMEDMARKAEDLAKRQQEFGNKLRQNFGSESAATRAGQSQQQLSEQMAHEKEQISDDLKALESEMQKAARDLTGTQASASKKLRDALGTMQQEELQTRMKWTIEALRRGLGSYAIMREAPVTAGMNQLRDQVRQAQAALDKQQPDATEKGLQQALAQAEKLRHQIEQMGGQRDPSGRNQKGQGNQKGQNGEKGQNGQDGQGQDGQQAGNGQKGGQGQKGGEGQSSSQSGDGQQQGGDAQNGGQRASAGSRGGGGPVGPNRAYNGGHYGGPGPGGWDARNMGDWEPADPATMERAYNDAVRDFGRLQQAVGSNPEIAKDLAREMEDLRREMAHLDPRRFAGNPKLLEELHAKILADSEQIEMMLRRKLEEKQGSSVRSETPQNVPPGYQNAVAEYFRRLSKDK